MKSGILCMNPRPTFRFPRPNQVTIVAKDPGGALWQSSCPLATIVAFSL